MRSNMDKKNSTLYTLKKQEIHKLFSNDKKALLRELEKSGILQRKRKLKSYSLLLHAAKLYLVDHLSFRRLSYKMTVLYKVRLSDTAWKKQLYKFAPAFLTAAQTILNRRIHWIADTHQMRAIDATHFSMEGKQENLFRVHTSIYLKSKVVEQLILTDQHIGESVKNFCLQPGCCYLADRAYGNASQMAYMMENQAEFIFRISPSKIRLFYDPECQKRIDCKSLLSNETFSISCFFKYRHKAYPIQLVGSMLPEDKQKAAQIRIKRISQKKQHKTRPDTLIFANWLLLATSLHDLSPYVYECYRQRWQIEIFFKTAKSLLNFHKLRRCSDHTAIHLINIWMAIVFLISALYIKACSVCSALPSFFFSFDFLLAFFA